MQIADQIAPEADEVDADDVSTTEVEATTQLETYSPESDSDIQGEVLEALRPEGKSDTIAIVAGKALTFLPKDLYIPPDALQVFLEAFEGPLDLLLYLIRRQNVDILNIPVAEITTQYVTYVEMMHEMNFELAAEYLVMAAMLAEIKSRMLLPRPQSEDTQENDPRAELIRRLQEYERFKEAAEKIDQLPRHERDFVNVSLPTDHFTVPKSVPQVDLKELLVAMADVMKRAKLNTSHQVERETLSLRERMIDVLQRVKSDSFLDFRELFTVEEGRAGVVVTFIAILELLRQSMIEMVQAESFGPIHVKAV